MTNLPKLTEVDVRRWTGSRDFQRGQGYYSNGNIQYPQQQGLVLKAQCHGSMATPYHVQVTLTASGIGDGTCSCPVGYRCKHTVALLLTWIHQPDAFTETETLLTNLAQRSQKDLIAIIQKMLERAPELESVIELQTLGNASPTQPISPDIIRRQISHALASGGDEWGAGYKIQRHIMDVVATGATYAEREDWRNATTVYATVAKTVLDEYENVYGDEGEVLTPVHDCVAGLGLCLVNTTDVDQRAIILRALFDVYNWDVNHGGVGVADDAPFIIRDKASPAEKAQVADWVRENLPSGNRDSSSSKWKQQAYGGFLLDLEADLMDDEAYLRVCRATGRTKDFINRLLELERVDEAIATAQPTEPDYALLALADIFTQHGYAEHIHRLIAARALSSQDTRLREWLKDYAQRHNQPEQALELAETLFRMRPSLEGYQELQTLAETLKQWDALRQRTQVRLLTDVHQAGLLIRIHLMEKDVARAIQVLKIAARQQARSWGWQSGYGSAPLHIQVAQAAAKDFPYAAIEIYTNAVFRLIEARGRENYTTAAQYLLRLRGIYGRLNDHGRFTSLLQNLRDSNTRLRALKEELKKVGL